MGLLIIIGEKGIQQLFLLEVCLKFLENLIKIANSKGSNHWW